jgi:hypothetical protein
LKRIVKYITFLNIILLVSSCVKEQKYSKIPHIEFEGFEIKRDQQDPTTLYGDSIVVKIRYEDGDGDLGLAQNDLNSYGNNYIINIYARQNGVFKKLNFDPSFDGQFPKLNPDNVVGPIDGVLSRSLFLYHSSPITPDDTLRFDIKILDRANNESNTITTPTIIVYK